MLKKYMLVLVAAGALSIAAPLASAQDNQSNDQAPSQENGGRHHGYHGQPDPAERTARLTKKLNLTSDQQPKVLAALQSEKSQMESLHQDTSLSQQDRRAKMMDIRQVTDSQIRGLLDSTQQKKWDEMQAEREQRMGNRHSGGHDGGSGQPSAPPQN